MAKSDMEKLREWLTGEVGKIRHELDKAQKELGRQQVALEQQIWGRRSALVMAQGALEKLDHLQGKTNEPPPL